MKSENAEDRRALLRGGRRYVCAYGCARAWATLTFTGTSGAGVLGAPSSDFDSHLTFDIAFIAVSILVVLLFRRLVPLNENRVVKAVSSGCMAAASLLCVATAWIPGASLGLMVAGSLAAGVGYGLFLLLAAEVLATFSLLRIFLFLSGAMLLGSVITFFCEGLVGLQAQAMLVLLPLLATLCLQGAYEHVPAADRPKWGVPKFSYPWKLFVLYGLYAFAYGMRANQLVAGAGRHSSASTFILMAVLFATAYFASKRFNIGLLYRSPVVLMVCGFLLVPAESLFGTAASSYLISMSYSLVGIIVALLLYDISKRLGVTVVIFAAIKGAEQVFVIWGKGVAEAMVAAGMNAGAQDAVIAVAVVAMMLAATLILLSEKELASRWGVRILDAGGLVEKTPEELRRDERAAALAEHARLTPRETEILALVAQGKNGPAIMQELFIAEGTFKAHMSHIYEKCEVSSRQALIDLLQSHPGD